MPRTEGGGQDWVHPFFSNNLPTAYLNPRAVTRHLADKVSKGHTRGLAWCEKTLSQALPFSFQRKFVTLSGASVGIVPPRDIASISSQQGNSFLRVPEGIVLENLEVVDPLLYEIAIYEKTQRTTNEPPLKQQFGETQS